MNAQQHQRWQRAQDHERVYWQERGDVAAVLARRRPHYETAIGRIKELLPENPTVVDVGSGPTCWGRFLPGTRVYVDPLMGSYREKWGGELPEGYPVAAQGETIPLTDGCCDLALSLNAIDHCADPAAVLRECLRILRPGGLLALSVYVHPPIRAALRKVREAVGFASDPHPYSFTRRSTERLLAACGLEVIEVIELGAISFRTRAPFWKRTEPLFLARSPEG